MVVLALFIALAFGGALGGASELAIGFSWGWLNPFAIESFAAFAAGLSLSIFIFWGWDTTLTVNEETTGSSSTPGRAALLTILTILGTYLLVAISAQMFAGIGEQGIGLGNPDTADNVFAVLAEPVLGVLAVFLFLAVVASAAAACRPRSCRRRGRCSRCPSTRRRPSVSPACIRDFGRRRRDAVLRRGHGDLLRRNDVLSEDVLIDTIYALGLMIAFYYSLTAFACVWYFRGSCSRARRLRCSRASSRVSAG